MNSVKILWIFISLFSSEAENNRVLHKKDWFLQHHFKMRKKYLKIVKNIENYSIKFQINFFFFLFFSVFFSLWKIAYFIGNSILNGILKNEAKEKPLTVYCHLNGISLENSMKNSNNGKIEKMYYNLEIQVLILLKWKILIVQISLLHWTFKFNWISW